MQINTGINKFAKYNKGDWILYDVEIKKSKSNHPRKFFSEIKTKFKFLNDQTNLFLGIIEF